MSTCPMVSGSMPLDLRYVYFAVPAFTPRASASSKCVPWHFRGGVSILVNAEEV